jgi:hypothetical protein
MSITVKPGPSYQGRNLMEFPGVFGELKSSADFQDQPVALRERMQADGYLYLPGRLDPDVVSAARNAMIDRLESVGALDPEAPRDEVVAHPELGASGLLELAMGVPEMHDLLYDGEMMAFWDAFLGGPTRHFDYTWFRAGTSTVEPTAPHCDTVFMNRGTEDLYTAWTPLMDVPYELGGLMILEKSHTRGDLLGEYWKMDVDEYCSNGPEADAARAGAWQTDKNGGCFDRDAFKLQDVFQQRWLGTEFKAGDILVFGMHTLHAAADNTTKRIRMSTDSRYQLASEPADERWVGAEPVGHGPNAKKGMIC